MSHLVGLAMVGLDLATISDSVSDGAHPKGSTHHSTMSHLVGLAMVGLDLGCGGPLHTTCRQTSCVVVCVNLCALAQPAIVAMP
jgi:hypothetical protein